MDTLDRVAAELGIRNLVARYADAIHRRDPAGWGDTWAEDGIWRLPGLDDPAEQITMTGRDTLVAAWQAAMAGFPFVWHAIHSGHIAWDGDAPTGRWYLSERLLTADGQGLEIFGVYDDRYARTDAGWRFSERTFAILYRGPADLAGERFACP